MILEILNKIASDNGKIFKLGVLEENKENELFKKVCSLAYCPLTQFYIRQIPEVDDKGIEIDLDRGLSELTKLSSRALTGHEGRDHLQYILSALTDDDAEVIRRVIGKDLKAGFSASSINKAFGKQFIKETPYMGAISYSEKKVRDLFKEHNEVYSEVKMDGRYANIKLTDSVYMESRGGKETDFGDTFTNLMQLRKFAGTDIVLNAELIIPSLTRYESNGAIASIVSIQNKITEGKDVKKEKAKFVKSYGEEHDSMMKKIIAVAWDYITLEEYEKTESKISRKIRMESLGQAVNTLDLPNLKFIEFKKVDNYYEAQMHFQAMLARGEEGTILKGADGTWKDGKPKWQVKMKLEMTVDLEISGFNYGTKGTKNEKLISSIDVVSNDRKLKTSPTGITEKDMKIITENQEKLLHTIVEVKCSGLSNNSKGEYALLHPVFIGFRTYEKTVADSLEQIKENEEMIKGLA